MGDIWTPRQRVTQLGDAVGFGADAGYPLCFTIDAGIDQTDDAHHALATQPLVTAGDGLFGCADGRGNAPKRHSRRQLQRLEDLRV